MTTIIKFKNNIFLSPSKLIPHEFFFRFIQFSPSTFSIIHHYKRNGVYITLKTFENMIMQHAFPRKYIKSMMFVVTRMRGVCLPAPVRLVWDNVKLFSHPISAYNRHPDHSSCRTLYIINLHIRLSMTWKSRFGQDFHF